MTYNYLCYITLKKDIMRPIYLFITLFSFFTSCTPIYQVFELSSSEIKPMDKSVIFENKDVKLTYNFWSNGGQVYFKFTNKTDTELYIDWDKSHLIYNGISYEYWNDVEETNSFYASLTSSTSNTFSDASVNIFSNSATGYSSSTSSSLGKKIAAMSTTKVKPKKVIYLPAKSSVVVSKFTINKSPYYNCDFNLKVMNSKSSKKVSFTKENSPLEFRNQIVYSTDDKFNNKVSVDNSFYISSISFMSEKTFKGKSYTEKECNIEGSKTETSHSEYPFKKPNTFYIIAKRQ